MVSIIIPAFNEEQTIRNAVLVALRHPKVSEVIVVDDGSKDDTALIARSAGAKVISLEENSGKAFAMDVGVLNSKNETLFFMDADRHGYTNSKITEIIEPVISGKYEMFVGVGDRKIFRLNWLSHFFPIIGGERALTKEFWNSIDKKNMKNFMIETVLNFYAKKTKKGMGHVYIEGIGHVTKEKKHGYFVGFKQRLVMIYEVLLVSFRLYIIENLRIFLKKNTLSR